MQKKGTIGVKILSLEIKSDFKLNTDYLLRIKHGYQISDITANALHDKIWFDFSNDTLQITLNNRKMDNPEIGYAEVKLTQIMKYSDCLHKIHIHLSAKTYNQWLQKEAALLILQFLYYLKPLQGKLKIIVSKAELTRDTQAFTKMDPYVKIKYHNKQFTTKTKDEAGKTPEWNEEFELDITNLSQRLEFIVYDKDVSSDDEVGSVDFKLRESNILSTNKMIEHNFELQYKKQRISAGFLKIKTHFIPAL